MEHVDDSTAKIAIGIACVVAGVGIGEVAGSTVGRAISKRISWRPAQAVDRTLGLFGYAVAVLVVIWLIAVPLASVPFPWLSSAIRGSAVLAKVDEAMPSQAQDVSAQLREVFNDSGFPAILDPLAPTPNTSVDPPDPAAGVDAGGGGGRRVDPQGPGGRRILRPADGGHRVRHRAAGKVLTNAHVVAGSDRAGGRVRTARPWTAPSCCTTPQTRPGRAGRARPDRAGADVRDRPRRRPAPMRSWPGYPLDGPYTLTPARVRSTIQLRGPNIYSSATVTREVYTLRAQVRPGNSGGPLLAPDGTVLGVIFGAAIDETDVGFALTADEVAPVVQAGLSDDSAASTQGCTAA